MKSMRFRAKETPPKGPEDGALAKRFEGRVRLSWLALFGERVWEALLWPFLVVAAFLVVSLLGAVEPAAAADASRGAGGIRARADRLLPAAAQTVAADPAGGVAAA